jgi:hypothetical protein
MELTRVRPFLVCGVLAVLCWGAAVDSAFAQTPGAPVVTVLPDNSVAISYEAPVTPPSGTLLVATLNGQPVGPFQIGTATSFSSGGPVPPGTYTVQIVWSATVASPVTSFVVSAIPGSGGRPAATIMRPAVVNNIEVTLTWDPLPNALGYDVEAVFFETGRVFNMTVGPQTTLVVGNVPYGNYLVRVRGRNSSGAGPYSNQVLVVVGPTIRLRDLEVTLTWNTLADVDLHIIEPNGNHVSFQRKDGTTAFYEGDNTVGFGPETTFIHPGGAALGVYQIYIVHYQHDLPTVSTVSITLNVGSPSARTEIYRRQTLVADSGLGVNVALVDVRGGLISEVFGTRATLQIRPSVKPE